MSDALRVLHVLGGLNRGGAETMLMNLYRTIDRTKIQFDFIIHSDSKQDYTDEILEMGGRIYSFPKYSLKSCFAIKGKWRRFFTEHPEYKIMHSHLRSYASVYFPIAKKFGLKTIIHSHSTSNGRGLGSIAKKILQYPLRHQADYFFGCSKESAEWLVGKKAVSGDRYHTLPNSISTERFKFNTEARERIRAEKSFGEKTVYVHVGRLHPAKNHDFLIEVFAKIHEKNPESALMCVGEGELRAEIEARIHQLGLSDSVCMIGSVPNVEDYLMAADAFLFPSKWEGVPVTVVEAQAAGLPCFVSDKITEGVCISELVTRLPIDQGADVWEKAIGDATLGRLDVIEKIKKSGYDVNSSAEWLADFYESLQKE